MSTTSDDVVLGRGSQADETVRHRLADQLLERSGATFFLERHRPDESTPYLRIARIEGGYLLQHVDGIDLEVMDRGERVVITRREPSLSQAAVDHILLDQMLPLVAAHRGQLSFHGSAVGWQDKALCFLAASGAGKSTLAATLVKHAGALFVSDDHVVLEAQDGAYVIKPSYPSVRLWTASAEALFGARNTASKRRFDLPTADAPVRVRALVLLHAAAPDDALVSIEALTRRDGLVGIAEQLDRLDPTDREALRRELDQLAQLVEVTPVVRIRVARDLRRLGEVAQFLHEWALHGA